jgi:hypothetical protein
MPFLLLHIRWKAAPLDPENVSFIYNQLVYPLFARLKKEAPM